MLNFDSSSTRQFIESPSDVSFFTTPLISPHLSEVESISWRDLKKDQEIADLQEFHRSNTEYWAYFTNMCPHFPEVSSSEEAKKLLECFKKDPYVSQFMPLLSRISYPRALSIVYENIKNNFITDQVVEICSYYLLNKSYEPEVLTHATSLLRSSDPRLYSDEENRDLFDYEYRKAKETENLRTFTEKLSEIIPLEELAEIRLAVDMMLIVDRINSSLNPEDQFISAPIHGYRSYKNQIANLRNWLEAHKEQLSSLTELDLSQTGIQRFPKELLPYLSGLHSVYLTNSAIEDLTILIDLLQLPNLEHLDFSSNSFSDASKFDSIADIPLCKALERAKHLQTLNLSNSCFIYNKCQNLINLCCACSINLILDALSDKEQDLVYICQEINSHLPEKFQIPIPKSNLFEPQKRFFERIHTALEQRREALEQIENLDFSHYNITYFPPALLPFLPNVRSVNLNDCYYEGADLFPAVKTLLQLEGLETIYLSNNNINADFMNRMLPFIQISTTLKKIYILNNPVDLEEIPALVAACISKEIDIIYSLPKKQKELLIYCRDLLLIDPSLKISSYSYKVVIKYLSEIFGGRLKNLNISDASGPQIPEEVLPYYSEVREIEYSGKKYRSENTLSMMKSILMLPKIEAVDFSANNLDDEDIEQLIESFKMAPYLKHINLSNNPWNPEEHKELIQYCYDRNIQLLRPYTEKESNIIASLQAIQRHVLVPPILENGKILSLIPPLFTDDQHILEQLRATLEEYKDALASIPHLNFSNLKIHRFPSVIIPYLSKVTSVCLKNTTPSPIPCVNRFEGIKNHQLLANMVNLPNLEEIDFSNNEISSASLACLATLIQKPHSRLRKIDISDCTYRQEFLDELYRLCKIHGVQIVRTLTKEERDLIDLIELINKDFSIDEQIPIPHDFSSYEGCLELLRPFLELHKHHLQKLKKLNLSSTTIDKFPKEILQYISGIETVILQNYYKKAPER